MTTKRTGHCATCGKPSGYYKYCYAHRKAKRTTSRRRSHWTTRITGGTYEPLTAQAEPEAKPLVESVGPVFIIPTASEVQS